MIITINTPIMLCTGEIKKVQDIKQGDRVYAYDIKLNTIIETEIISVNKNISTNEFCKIEFYNTSHVILDKEQEVILKNGKTCKSKKIKPGNELMPFSVQRLDNNHCVSKEWCIVKLMKWLDKQETYILQTQKKNCVIMLTNADGGINEAVGCILNDN